MALRRRRIRLAWHLTRQTREWLVIQHCSQPRARFHSLTLHIEHSFDHSFGCASLIFLFFDRPPPTQHSVFHTLCLMAHMSSHTHGASLYPSHFSPLILTSRCSIIFSISELECWPHFVGELTHARSLSAVRSATSHQILHGAMERECSHCAGRAKQC